MFTQLARSSGGREAKGRITHTGSAHLRHVLGEAAWHARHRPWLNLRLKKLLPTLPAGVAEIAWKAQERLHRKFTRMTYCRKHARKVATDSASARAFIGLDATVGNPIVANNAGQGFPGCGSPVEGRIPRGYGRSSAPGRRMWLYQRWYRGAARAHSAVSAAMPATKIACSTSNQGLPRRMSGKAAMRNDVTTALT